MKRAGNRGAFLRLPIAQKKVRDIDENASDGYDQPGRLVINTSEYPTENLPASDWSEIWMKTGCEQSGEQQEDQFCQFDLGNQCFVVGKPFKGQILIHVRRYDRRKDGTLFRTKKRIALNLEKWKKLQYWYQDSVDTALNEYRDSKQVDLDVHLGQNYRVTVKSGYPLVNIRR